MSRYDELLQLREDFDAGTIAPEVAQKRAAQLLGAFKTDRAAWARAAILWNNARAAVSAKQRAARGRHPKK